MAEQEPIAFGFGPVDLLRDATLGAPGNYGQVCKAMLGELPCAAKLLHPTVVDPNRPNKRALFERECRFLSQIRHPNIVQYLGVDHDEAQGLSILLMELMDDSLTHFLELSEARLPYHVQVNINYDIAQALAFLHTNRIVHRALSSNNVLLIGAGIRAKVTDFGMSKLLSLNPRKTPLTKCPGTPAYMSPEALLDPPIYTEKLDCFQTGVLIVQIITRKFPNPGPAMNRVRDERYKTGWINAPVPEAERRDNHLRLVTTTHPMFPLAMDCLKDTDTERPSAQQICHRLSDLKETLRYRQSLKGGEGVDSGERDGDIQERDQLIQQLQQENEKKEREIRGRERGIQERDQLIQQLQQENEEKEREIRGRERENQSLRDELQKKEDHLQKYDGISWVVRSEEIQPTQHELGRGAWAEVVIAEFRGLQVAAKCLHSELLSNYNRDLFVREMNIAAELRHPNLVQFIGATLEGRPVILTELMTISLRAQLGKGPLESAQIQSISRDVALALNYMHLARPEPILHRDISSANVLLHPTSANSWVAKVSDYGSANFLYKVNTTGPGNPAYSAPEASNPSKQSVKMDVFSFGVMLVEMVIQKSPDQNIRTTQINEAQKKCTLILAQLIQKCVDHDPLRRPAIGDVLSQL